RLSTALAAILAICLPLQAAHSQRMPWDPPEDELPSDIPFQIQPDPTLDQPMGEELEPGENWQDDPAQDQPADDQSSRDQPVQEEPAPAPKSSVWPIPSRNSPASTRSPAASSPLTFTSMRRSSSALSR